MVMDTIYFPHTGEWTNWTMSNSLYLDLDAGDNKIRIEAYNPSGLGNYDYLSVIGDGVTGSQCTPTYIIAPLDLNIPAAGTVSYEPVQQYYEEGTLITLIAHANSGYFFQSWTGTVTSRGSIAYLFYEFA
jgi:pectate lyase